MAKKSKFVIFLLIIFEQLNAQSLIKVNSFGKNSGNLKMYIHLPKNNFVTEKIPLVLVLHGCTQSAKVIANATGWNKLSDTLNFMLIYPEQKQINNAGKCFNFFIGFKAKKDKGEVASIKQMINFSIKNYRVDSNKIFITGMSAGGGMSNAMLNAYPNLFKAGALIEAPSVLIDKENTSKYQPKVAIFQGKRDLVVAPSNAKKLINQWVKINKIDTNNLVFKEHYLGNSLLSAKSYFNKNNELKIIVIYAKGVGHKVLINPGKGIKHGGKMGLHTQNINFHSTYWIANFFGLTKD